MLYILQERKDEKWKKVCSLLETASKVWWRVWETMREHVKLRVGSCRVCEACTFDFTIFFSCSAAAAGPARHLRRASSPSRACTLATTWAHTHSPNTSRLCYWRCGKYFPSQDLRFKQEFCQNSRKIGQKFIEEATPQRLDIRNRRAHPQGLKLDWTLDTVASCTLVYNIYICFSFFH
jgi:hypothetical protein